MAITTIMVILMAMADGVKNYVYINPEDGDDKELNNCDEEDGSIVFDNEKFHYLEKASDMVRYVHTTYCPHVNQETSGSFIETTPHLFYCDKVHGGSVIFRKDTAHEENALY